MTLKRFAPLLAVCCLLVLPAKARAGEQHRTNLVAAAFLPGWRVRQLAVALGGVVLFLIGVLSEVDVRIFGAGTVEPDRIATVFLMTTYYGGALLVSLGMLALVVWSSGRPVAWAPRPSACVAPRSPRWSPRSSARR